MRVTAGTTSSELAREINRHPGFRATVWGRHGLRRVYVRRYQYVSRDRGINESVQTTFTIYVEFIPGCSPLLTVKEADMNKDPQSECMMVSAALSRVGIHVDSKPSPLSVPYHNTIPSYEEERPCGCLSNWPAPPGYDLLSLAHYGDLTHPEVLKSQILTAYVNALIRPGVAPAGWDVHRESDRMRSEDIARWMMDQVPEIWSVWCRRYNVRFDPVRDEFRQM